MLNVRSQIRVQTSADGKRSAVAGNPIASTRSSGAVSPRAESSKKMETAAGLFGQNGNMNSMNTTMLPQNGQLHDTMLSGLIGDNEASNMRFYRDIYSYDSVAGSCVDLMSTMPFSDFNLIGCEDPKRLGTYEAAIESLNLKTLFPEISVDYLVTGAFLATLVYKANEKKFVDLIPWRREDCDIAQVPFLGIDPVIKVKPNPELRDFLNNSDPEFEKLRNRLNGNMLDALRSDNVDLDSLTTIFMPRKTYTHATKGTSFYKRILPIYLLEKALYRGTLVEAGRRQRAMLHLQMGDDMWEPTPEEMQAVVALFQQADLDPLGAIVATRGAIQPAELRQGGDFWKYTDLSESTTVMKLRALGISESFLSGDATYASMEVSLSVFIENLRSYRTMATHKVFNGKLFPLIAHVNNFMRKKDKAGKVLEEAGFGKMKLQHKLNDATMLDMPTVHWHKALRPEADQAYMEVLGSLKEHGVPVPITLWAAAGGLTMDTLLKDLEDEQEVKKKIAKITNGDPDYARDPEGGDGEGGGSFGEESRLRAADRAGALRAMMGRRRVALLSRNFDHVEYTKTGKTGKTHAILNQTQESNRQYDVMHKLMKSHGKDPHQHARVLDQVRARNGSVPNMYNGR
jgi:hypothetical protein